MSNDFIKNLKADAERLGRDDMEGMLEAVQGATIVGILNDQEIAAYVILADMELDLSDLQETYMKRHLSRSVDKMVNSDELSTMGLQSLINLAHTTSLFDNVTEAEDFFMRVSNFEAQTSLFWNKVRTRLNNFSQFLEVRHGWRVVSLGSKYR